VSELAKHNDSTGSTTFLMHAVPPFRLDLTAWALRRRPENLVDRWDGQTYRRVLVLEGRPVEIEVSQSGTPVMPRLRVTATGSRITHRTKQMLRASIDRMLGAQVDLSSFYRLATQQPELEDIVRHFRGLKPPRFPTVFESLLNAFACQQVSLAVGVLLLNRLTERYGLAIEKSDGRICAFPRSQDIAGEKPEALRKLGFSRQKARAIIELSLAVTERSLDLEQLAELDGDPLLDRLNALRGVGRWSAEYVSLRGLGKLDVFPGDDVGAQNKLQRYLGLRRRPNYKAIRRRFARWGPYAGLIYFHLLLQGLSEKGYMQWEKPKPKSRRF